MTEGEKQKAPVEELPREIRIVAHSMIFYWWPVWAVGFLLFGLSWLSGHRLAVVPAGTQIEEGVQGGRDALVLPAGAHMPRDSDTGKPRELNLRVVGRSGYGVVFTVLVFLVILITNVPIRGLWSVIVILLILLVTVVLALANLWDDILEAAGYSHVYMNGMGYLAFALPLLILWFVTVRFFDSRTYMLFAPGQLKVCQEVGSGEVAYDTVGMAVAKRRSDLFRHWLLGFGSGDLIVKTAGAHSQQLEMRNVLFVGTKLALIQEMLQTRQVVSGA
jgi:hypothetical protein